MMSRHRHSLIVCLSALLLCFGTATTRAQALWEIGAKAGESFYLGDDNRTLFNDLALAVGVYGRYNWNARWASKVQIVYGKVSSPIDKHYLTGDVQMEFNFFPYGQMNTGLWSRFFTPYICVGVGLNSFDDSRDKMHYAFNVPFGIGVKCKVLRRINVGLEWTMHKMFTDKFDDKDNPYDYADKSTFANMDWFSMATLFVGIDLGTRGKFCR